MALDNLPFRSMMSPFEDFPERAMFDYQVNPLISSNILVLS